MNHENPAARALLQKCDRRQKKIRPAMKVSGRGLKRFARAKPLSKH